jgi:hypothetical protein
MIPATAHQGGSMPDFDHFERLLKSVLDGELSISEGARKIASLDEANKVRVVKGKSAANLEAFLTRTYDSLRAFFPNGTNFTSNDDNRSGKDLYEVNSMTHIELKSGGAMTDGNPGLESVAWALNNPKVAAAMKDGMTERRRMLLAGQTGSAIEASKSKTMDELFSALQSTPLGVAPERLAHYFRCMAVGLTKLDEIKESYSATNVTKTPLMLMADWDSGLALYEKAFLPSETIEVVRIERTDRAQLVARGSTTGRTATLYPNYKNSWTAPNGQKFDAKNWVATACFHVWID